jgi:hypothetical protein
MRALGGGAHSNDCDTSVRVFAMVKSRPGRVRPHHVGPGAELQQPGSRGWLGVWTSGFRSWLSARMHTAIPKFHRGPPINGLQHDYKGPKPRYTLLGPLDALHSHR